MLNSKPLILENYSLTVEEGRLVLSCTCNGHMGNINQLVKEFGSNQLGLVSRKGLYSRLEGLVTISEKDTLVLENECSSIKEASLALLGNDGLCHVRLNIENILLSA
ncbi:hypothetical protein K08M3_50230 [Vibrio alginolyticus]|uniref:Uncharacterized protein n=2 Tax=Vibrio TaxID=662 RepID=A0A1W6U138_VIBAL|nr:hypothetical protein K04M1_50100 [Vibrio alginolyticus]WKV20338.1 hypothetical protein [Vibrio parahaemolyticus]ARP11666.1 hypothetical protein K04M3_50970 [Vibrio alginolyticus]ARP16719.1 hypothetical protein K04M5_50670 [Vibrio alginolyticus]ARP21739.1 hypothetical protein K05K4_50300 [Vibrio alginolyticus]